MGVFWMHIIFRHIFGRQWVSPSNVTTLIIHKVRLCKQATCLCKSGASSEFYFYFGWESSLYGEYLLSSLSIQVGAQYMLVK